MSPDATPAAEVAALREGDLPAPQHAALRRIAALAAAGAPARELFGAVVREITDVLALSRGWLFRYEAGPAMSVLASVNYPPFPVGSRWPLDGSSVAATIRDTGRPARLDDHSGLAGTIARRVREVGVRSVCGVPIFVDGGIWGGIGASPEDNRLLPADTTERLAAFTELVAGVISSAATRDRLATLADHQTSLRRVATLVAEEAPAAELFAAVTVEATRVLEVPAMVVSRYEGRAEIVVVASRNARRFTVGSRWALDEPGVAARVYATGRPARIEDYSGLSGRLAAGVRDSGLGSVVGVPIMVEGRIWGVGCAGTGATEALPAGIEDRLRDFTDLVGIAIANAESRQRPRRLAEEQAALRRVATLVAEGAAPAAVFSAVAREVAHILDVAAVTVVRFESNETSVVVASHNDAGFPVGSRWPLDGPSLHAMVFQSGLPARLDDHEGLPGPVAAAARASGVRSGIAVPITVDGRVWGMIAVGLRPPRATLPAHAGMLSSRLVLSAASAQEIEQRLTAFTELVATAISKAQVHDDLRSLAAEQAALRRVATLVAQDVPSRELFGAVAGEVGVLLGADLGGMIRYEDDGTVTAVATWAAVGEHPPVPEHWQIEPGDPAWMILESRAATRVEDWASVPGPFAEAVRNDFGVSSSVGCPIVVAGRLWGALAIHSKQSQPLPPDTESRIAQFTDLVGTAIANAESRGRADRLAKEQAALRRVATLVAKEASPAEVFAKVAEEVGLLLGLEVATVRHFEPDGCGTIVGRWGNLGDAYRVGSRMRQEGESVTTLVYRTGRSARFDDYLAARAIPADARALGLRGAVASPIVVNGRLWGAIAAGTSGAEPMPADAESRIAEFTELVATAISNVQARSDLAASRARIVAAADQERRRVVRDLHDGAQQRLVHTIITLGLAQQTLRENTGDAESLIGEALEHAKRGNLELRELAHGILPSALTRGGLRAGVDAVLSRVDLPVQLDVPAERFPAEIEASAYFIVAEALTNVVKHSRAEHAQVRASVEDGMLRVEIRDDGIGGADPDGHGLVGMGDRVTALGGRLEIDSPPGGGTLVAATLPLSAG